ncbi:potassium channel, sub T, member 2 [Chytriomyces hyalinus]|nr:potassium channel, sub T, member 2 [Chytriomyces hyalinus]
MTTRDNQLPARQARIPLQSPSTEGFNRESSNESIVPIDFQTPESALEEQPHTASVVGNLNHGVEHLNYAQARQAYIRQKKSDRQISKSNQWISSVLHVLDVRTYYRVAKSFAKSEGFDIGITILDLVSDLLFCTLYLFDIQWALNNLDDPVLTTLPAPPELWIARRGETFMICFVFSVYNVFSWCFALIFADNKLSAVLGVRTWVTLLSSVPFIVSIYYATAKFLYIPFFLAAITAVDRLRKVLRLRGATSFLNFNSVVEKSILLGGTLIAIVYVAVCVFQYVEFRFGNQILSILNAFYFVVVTLSTVGYGDVTAKSKQGQVVVILLIITALAVLPPLISSLVDTIAQQQGGNGGTYVRGKAKYFVVLGNFDLPIRIEGVLTEILGESLERDKVVILGRTPSTPALKAVMNSYRYRGRVSYLVGSGMDASDLERAQIRHASAVYIIADRAAEDRRLEDEQNTLRAWAIHIYAPDTPLYVSNLLPDTQAYQEVTVDAAVCVDDLRHLVLSLTVMYEGAATLLINLIHTSVPQKFRKQWEAQYDDGQGNEIHVVPVNPVFAGVRFSDVSWYCYREFQITMIGVRVYARSTGLKTLVLNPGQTYRISEQDDVVFMTQSFVDLAAFNALTKEEFQKASLKSNTKYDRESGMLVGQNSMMNPPVKANHSFSLSRIHSKRGDRRAQSFRDSRSDSSIATGQAQYMLDKPEAPSEDFCVPVCLLSLANAPLKDLMVEHADGWEGHLLVCTGGYDVFKFICGLRASHLEAHLKILFLCERAPSLDEFDVLSMFPELYFMVGDPRKKRALLKAGIRGCSKVVIMGMTSNLKDEFAGSGAIMVQHLIHQMIDRSAIIPNKCVILEVPKRSLIHFLHPSPTTTSISYRRRFRSAVTSAAKNFLTPSSNDSKGKVGGGTLLKPKQKPVMKQSNFLYTPIFASGRVVSSSMLDSILFQLHRNPTILEVFMMLCGVGGDKLDAGLSELYGVRNAWIGQVSLPKEFENRSYGDLYAEFASSRGIIPLGIYRPVHPRFGNSLPFVFTNPGAQVILHEGDLVFVLAP